MRNKKKEQKKHSFVGALVLIVLLCMMTFELVHVYRQIASARAEQTTLSAQIQQVQEENDALQSDLDRANDPSFYQDLARSKLGLAEDGERIFYDVNH